MDQSSLMGALVVCSPDHSAERSAFAAFDSRQIVTFSPCFPFLSFAFSGLLRLEGTNGSEYWCRQV